MVSGQGNKGGRGRCFDIWQDFVKCMVKSGTFSTKACQPEREDYLECLHHQKLVRSTFDVILFKPIKCEQSARLDMIKAQKEQLIKEGKWPPSP